MSRLIDADKLRYTCIVDKCNVPTEIGCNKCQYHVITECEIDNAPTVEVMIARGTNGVLIPITRRTGRWKKETSLREVCPFCGDLKYHSDMVFCGHCGAYLISDEE